MLSLAYPQCPEGSCSHESVLVSPEVNASHLRLFHQVRSRPQRLELAPVLETRRAGPFVEDLHCLEFRYVDYHHRGQESLTSKAVTGKGVCSEVSANEEGDSSEPLVLTVVWA